LGARGGGLAVIHWGMGTRDAGPIEPFVKLFGGCHGGPDRKYRVVEEAIQIADPKHPATTGVAGLRLQEEWYYRLKFVKPEGSVRPLVQVTIDGQPETVSWAWERPDGGRSFGFSGLHFHGNWQQPAYRRLIGQAVLWTLKLPIPKDGLPVDIAADELKVQKEDRP
jgi:type 1 glutamine amidotransferase